ncbi:single-stranded DNA-binding protein [Helicobacter suis]|uniref:single-stranded DNA-binding protein n=1 Tax=Helicobacter suis TaxID=104628 RepID=UPI0013D39755|nr:single-stranded DNA-binding protein [Helicobacter suis]
MYNKIVLIGHFTRDVEIRHLPNGGVVGKVGIATNHVYKRQDGSKVEETCFIDVDLFGRTAEVANQYLHKGSKVLIEGRLKLENWSDQYGNKRSKHSVSAESLVMLDSKSAAQPNTEYRQQRDEAYSKPVPSSKPRQEEKIPEINVDDDLPF